MAAIVHDNPARKGQASILRKDAWPRLHAFTKANLLVQNVEKRFTSPPLDPGCVPTVFEQYELKSLNHRFQGLTHIAGGMGVVITVDGHNRALDPSPGFKQSSR